MKGQEFGAIHAAHSIHVDPGHEKDGLSGQEDHAGNDEANHVGTVVRVVTATATLLPGPGIGCTITS